MSEGTRRRRLGKTGESTEVHKWDTIYEANPKCRRDELHCPLVRGWVASDPQKLQRTIGCLITMGKGAAISSSNIMKCNTQSSTETELISVHDKLPDIIWTRYFAECQGYNIDEYIVFQDNMSSLSLEKNGRMSSSKRTKHIKAKYFLIKDYYDSGEIDLRYCLTDVMWADILTKPLQGQTFRGMQVFLQNCPRDYDDDIELQTDQLVRRSTNQQVKTVASSRECVGELANLARENLRRRGQSPTCVSKWSE